MLKTVHLRPEDYRTVPWKNGQGKSQEIALHPGSPFLWRLTQAPLLRSGPFSPYPGYQRSIVLMKGGPVTLSHQTDAGKRQRALSPRLAYSFQGDWETEAFVDSEAKDFNVFTLTGKASAKVYPISISTGEDLQFPISGQEHFIFCANGEMEVLESNDGKSYVLHADETLHVSRSGNKEYLNLRARALRSETACLWIVIRL